MVVSWVIWILIWQNAWTQRTRPVTQGNSGWWANRFSNAKRPNTEY
jgi:hypothetical protein